MSDLGKLSRKLILTGAGLMMLLCFSFLFDNLLFGKILFTETILTKFNFTLTLSVLNGQGWFWSSFFTFVTSLISLFGYKDLKKNPMKSDLYFIWGVFSIVLGIIGGTLGGAILSLAGVILIIEYFRSR